jgi:predicted short-subunit dehydrogenase-like oxidoreductase (DUF2520 family)
MNYTCGIIGAGRVATALSQAISRKKKLAWVLATNPKSAGEIRKFLPKSVSIISKIDEIKDIPEILILAVSDSAITELADEISSKFKTNLRNKYILHCSGSHSTEALKPCEKFGARIVAAHPYQTFYFPSKEILKGIRWGIECEERDFNFMARFIQSIGGVAVKLENMTSEKKALYHCSAIAASNYLTAAISLSSAIGRKSGIVPEKFQPSIIEQTVRNNFKAIEENLPIPLTGPIARGDKEILSHHIDALKSEPELLRSYIYFGLGTAEISLRNNIITKEIYEELVKLFKDALNSL